MKSPSNKIVGIAVAGALLMGCGAPPLKEKKVVIWHWMTDRQSVFEELAKEYASRNEIKIEFKLVFPPDIYSQKVIAAARANSLPDIFGILGEKKTVASFIKAGYITNLTPYMQATENNWQDNFYPQTIELTTFKKGNTYEVTPGIYGVPIDTTVMQFVYNKTIFKEAGLDPQTPPQTFQDLITYSKKIKETTGVDGFVCGGGEGWLLNALAVEWAINLMGEDKFIKTLNGEIPYTDKEWIEVFSLFSRLKESGILVSNIATMTNKESEDAFARGKAAFSFNGTWAVNVYNQLNPNLNYAFFSLPIVSRQYPIKIWGGAGSSFMVNAKSAQKEEAVKFLQWLTQKEQQKVLIEKTSNLAAVKDCEESLPVVLKNLIGQLNNLIHPDIWPKNEDSRVIEVMNRGLQQIIMELKTPQELTQEIQKIKERVSR